MMGNESPQQSSGQTSQTELQGQAESDPATMPPPLLGGPPGQARWTHGHTDFTVICQKKDQGNPVIKNIPRQ